MRHEVVRRFWLDDLAPQINLLQISARIVRRTIQCCKPNRPLADHLDLIRRRRWQLASSPRLGAFRLLYARLLCRNFNKLRFPIKSSVPKKDTTIDNFSKCFFNKLQTQAFTYTHPSEHIQKTELANVEIDKVTINISLSYH